MRSSTGEYYLGLDHVRALAAFVVFTWHFIHANGGQYAPPPTFPLSLLTEGHTGVALFMVLSGYLFAKLLDGKTVSYPHFVWNRFLRLAPLLFVVIVIVGIQRAESSLDLARFVVRRIADGAVKPTLPNGGWSITAEFHFYLLLPLLLFLSSKWEYSLVLVLLAAIALRLLLFGKLGEIQTLAYWTIVGRIDQFVLGILAYQFRNVLSGRHFLALFALLSFAAFIWYFDSLGGFYRSPSYPSPSAIWVFMPTIEGLAYGIAIGWYDTSFRHSTSRLSRFIANIGCYSYSIYLLHFFIVFRLSGVVHRYVVDTSNIHMAIAMSIPGFLLMVPIGYLSYRFLESPFLKFRTRYVLEQRQGAVGAKEGAESP